MIGICKAWNENKIMLLYLLSKHEPTHCCPHHVGLISNCDNKDCYVCWDIALTKDYEVYDG